MTQPHSQSAFPNLEDLIRRALLYLETHRYSRCSIKHYGNA